MLRVRTLLLKAALAASVVAGLAACDPSGAIAPRQHRPTPNMTSGDTLSGRSLKSGSVQALGDGDYCRSGYQVAYRDDGTPYCSPIE